MKSNPFIENTLFHTHPSIVHAHGSHSYKPNWQPILDSFFSTPKQTIGAKKNLTIITCNNGHPAMGLLERSLDHLGVPYQVYGKSYTPWVNSIHKPLAIANALDEVTTPYVLYADSRDAIFVNDPSSIMELFEKEFDCKLLFGADRLNWPPVKEFERFENDMASTYPGDFNYLNGGLWIGETSFCKAFFEESKKTAGVEKAAESEQGILKKLFMKYHPEVQLDYTCKVFQNIGFVATPIFKYQQELSAL
ncbi:glycosyltransferase domain-containing protein [uncultured Dokdonia sp.]|uniref:glycosyltransferase domain-containing protein n=1 Tax=uncultured Dokdonia sp. TaxID=575653 RepID=UPI00261F345F|nr:glycosyltransferase domain-containing protein [uncultured Dokdonia sp.]